MATAAEKKLAYEQWKERCKQVQSFTDTSLMRKETPIEKEKRIRRLQSNYAAFCEYYFPHFLQLRDKTTGEVIRTIHNAPFTTRLHRRLRTPQTSKRCSCGHVVMPNPPTWTSLPLCG